MNYKLGTSSESNLNTCCDGIQRVVRLAITISEVDFSVVEGVRDIEKQKENIANGVSWTLESHHLPNEDGVAQAVDIYPWVEGKTNHGEDYYGKIAKAIFKASQILGIQIEWGGLWTSKHKDTPHWQIVT